MAVDVYLQIDGIKGESMCRLWTPRLNRGDIGSMGCQTAQECYRFNGRRPYRRTLRTQDNRPYEAR